MPLRIHPAFPQGSSSLPPPPGSRLGVKLQFVFTAKKEGGGGKEGLVRDQGREGENVSKWSDKFPLFPNPSLSSPFSTFSFGQKNKRNFIPNSEFAITTAVHFPHCRARIGIGILIDSLLEGNCLFLNFFRSRARVQNEEK